MPYGAAVRTAHMQAIVDQAGTTAKLEIGTAGMAAILVSIPLGNPIGSVLGDVLTLDMPKSATAAATGKAAAARIRDGSNVDIRTGLTVAVSGANVNINDLDLEAGQTVEITSATLTHNG